MIKPIALLLSVFVAVAPPVYANQILLDLPIKRVIDGDTVEVEAKSLAALGLPTKLSLRILGVDTPEKAPHAHCWYENYRSLTAKLFTEQEIRNAKVVKIEIKKWDKYGGRVLGDIILDGERLSKRLIENDYAVEYHGEKKVKDWCK